MIEIDARLQPYEVTDLDAGTLLGLVAEDRVRDLAAARRKLRLAYQMAVSHPPTPQSPAAVAGDLTLIANDCEDPIVGDGTPDVALFAVEDYSAAAGITRHTALSLIGDVLDLVHRLPKLWAEVEALEIPAWKARRVALLTRNLSFEAARWFDDKLVEVGRYGWPTISQWLAYATAKFHPDQVKNPNEPVGKNDWDVRLRHHNTGRQEGSHGVGGTSELTALGDSLDLERFHALITTEAERMRREGDTDPLAQRRAKAIGRLVDDTLGPDSSIQGGLDLHGDAGETGDVGDATGGVVDEGRGIADAATNSSDVAAGPTKAGTTADDSDTADTTADAGAVNSRPKMTGHPEAFTNRRGLQVVVHITLADLLGLTSPTNADAVSPIKTDATSTSTGAAPTNDPDCQDAPRIASSDRVGQILVSQLRDWLARHGSIATITPVIDMNRTDTVDQHDPPIWMAQQVRLRVYPDCTRSAWACDLDHIDAYAPPDKGGPPSQTRPENLAPLCRRHHLVKTAGRWRYQRTPEGHYLWTNRYGHTYLVTPHGTINTTHAA